MSGWVGTSVWNRGVMSVWFFVYMAGPGICILCCADTCASYVNTVFNAVAHYRYLLPTMYLSGADISNPELFTCGCGPDFSRHCTLL